MRLTFKTKYLPQAFCTAALALACGVAQAQIAAQWTFESSFSGITGTSTTLGGISPEFGTGTASGVHAGAATWSSPAGNGSPHSFSVNTWAIGDYFQFQTSTLGLNNILVTFDQTSSGTGPRDFKFAFSTDGTTFTQFGSDYVVLANASPNPVWNSSTASPIYSYSFNLSSVPALNNASAVYFRIVDDSTVSANGGTVAVTGTDRIDNFTVQVVPEPSTTVLAGLGLFALVLSRRFRR
jgi:PEP-CTERM motif